MQINRSCKTCHFRIDGYCRKNPPQPINGYGEFGTKRTYWMYPVVSAKDWCFCWMPKFDKGGST